MPTLTKPTCLHIPALYEESTASVNWEGVDNAEGYEYDCVFNETFQSASTGKTWADLRNADTAWETYDNLYTWEAIAMLPAQGLTWGNIRFYDKAWADIDAANDLWAQLHGHPAMFTVYSGPGTKTRAPDQGLTWEQVNCIGDNWLTMYEQYPTWEQMDYQISIGWNWEQLQAKGFMWSDIAAYDSGNGLAWLDLTTLPAKGLSWDSFDSRYRSWEEIGTQSASWREAEDQLVDNKTHRSTDIEIPLYSKTTQQRVRAVSSAEKSPYLESSVHNITPIFYREDSITLSPRNGKSQLLQLSAQRISRYLHVDLTLSYRPAMIELRPASTSLGSDDAIMWNIAIHSHQPGKIVFRCTKALPAKSAWSGFVSLWDVVLKTDQDAVIQLS